ncbi:MAG: T9SS type A sorting domain-containing protein [Bacteroidales bacterium]|nr:T9SS type A sorting domain-containing protein [Bacteroidales bacterium]
MKLTKFAFAIICALFCSTIINAQIAIGEWRDHLPYNRTIAVAEAGQRIYCATQFSLFYYDNDDNSIGRYSKVNGLSDIGISAMAWSEEYQTLMIAYTNANIDLLKGGQIVNISDIKRKQILGNKTINNITFIDNLAYLSCGFGIVVLDIDKEEFPEPTYYIGDEGAAVNELDITLGNDTLYAATAEGIYKASFSSPNLAHYIAWSVDQRLYPDAAFNTIEFYGGKLLVNYFHPGYNSDTLYVYDYASNLWQRFPEVDHFRKFKLRTEQGKLIVAGQGNVLIYDENYNRINVIYQPGGISLNLRDATPDSDGNVWIADYSHGLIKTTTGWDAEFISPSGPYSANVFDMDLKNNELWVAGGGYTSGWGKLYLADGVYTFSNETWKSYNRANGVPAFDSISDMTCVAVDPNTSGHAYVGTWMQGVMEFQDGVVVNIYDHKNSSLQIWPEADYVAVSGIALDKNNNLWVANSHVPEILSVKKPNGEWKSFSLGSATSNTDIGKLFVDRDNQKWMTLRADNKLLVSTQGGTIDDVTDDAFKVLTNNSGNGNLPGNLILCVAQDHDGEIWPGSDEGIGVIYSPENIFNGGNFDAQRILVEVGGFTQYLLESESVTSIAIDGNNCKWIGTERAGAFYLSPDGTKEILHFTADNSPLYSNRVIDIQINGATGEVFFGTDKGIISYKNTSTDPPVVNTDVLVYPNPVREGYNGPIAIRGLVNNADVKITDISGALIFATRAEGGQAIWSGKSFSGRKASTGVYLVYATDNDGKEKLVTKVLFIN